MAAKKKITFEIGEAIRAKYQSGDYTQGDLSTEFHVSVPTINKVVKGVKPAKRKYTHRTSKYATRNAEIVRLYSEENKNMRDIAVIMDTTHQNISLILKRNGVDPQNQYFSKLAMQKEARQDVIDTAKAAKQAIKEAKVAKLSVMWKSGATIDEIRIESGLKSIGAAQVKLVHLRKRYGLEVFPKRSAFGMTPERQAALRVERDHKAAILSEMWKKGSNASEMSAVFGWKENSVTRRLPKLRKEYGEGMFPYRRARKEKAVVVPEDEVMFSSEDVAPETEVTFSAE